MRDIIDTLIDCHAAPETIRIIDVGAMSLGSDESWQGLVDRGAATLLGFEPQVEECARRNAENQRGCRFLPEAVGDGNEWTFHHCRSPATSSIFEPDIDFVSQFHGLSDLMEVVQTTVMPTRRLDDIEEARHADFIKLDTQGSELLILENAVETLGHVSMIQTEVSFAPLYKNQPLFADVDRFLRAQGFMFHTFLYFGQRAMQPLMVNGNCNTGLRQILWSDAVYIKPFSLSVKGPKPATLLKRAVLFHTLCQSFDFAARALWDYDRLTGKSLTEAYVSALGEKQAA